MVRTALIACAAALAFAAQPAAAEDTAGTCQTVNMRVYFTPGSASVDAAARDMLNAAARHVSDCSYAELHVRTGPDALSQARGEAIVAALSGHDWDVAQVNDGMAQRVSAGPEFVEVTMGPEVVDEAPSSVRGEAGV